MLIATCIGIARTSASLSGSYDDVCLLYVLDNANAIINNIA